MQRASELRSALAAASMELNPTDTMPVDLDAILHRVGVSLTFEAGKNEGRKGKAYLVLEDRPRIVLVGMPTCDQGLDREARFSVAHELAHWVIWRKFGALAGSKNEYWKYEVVCNEFAARLLLPPRRLTKILNDWSRTKHPVYFPSDISYQAQVTWDVAARAISALPDCSLGYLRLVSATRKSDGDQNVYKVASSSVSDKPGSFPGQNGLIRTTELFECLERLEYGKLHDHQMNANVGRLLFKGATTTILKLRQGTWAVQYWKSDPAVEIVMRTETIPGVAENVSTSRP